MLSRYLITCNHAKGRHDYIRNHLNGLFLKDWQVIFAPDYRILSGLDGVTRTHLSLTHAYIQTLSTALFQGNVDKILIMEDDVSFLPDSMPVIESLISELPEDFDLCYLTKTDANNGAKVEDFSENLTRIVSNWWETPLTLWSRKFAKEFLKYCEWKLSNGSIGNVDHELCKMNEGETLWPDAKQYAFYGSKHLTAFGLSTTKDSGFISSI